MNAAWHVDPSDLARYAAHDLDDVRASSLEAHVLTCADCREALAPLAPAPRLDAVWDEIAHTLDAPGPGIVERTLLRLGVRDDVARLLAATPSLRLSWIMAEAVALGSAAFAASSASNTEAAGGTLFVFLVLAALAPVAGVAVAFGRGMDPAYEIGIAAPMRGDRLLFIRAAAVLVASVVIGTIAALALPDLDRTLTLWLLPALGLTLTTLAVATWLRPFAAACTVALAGVAAAATFSVASADPLAPFHAPGQLVSVLAIAASALVLAQRRSTYEGRISS